MRRLLAVAAAVALGILAAALPSPPEAEPAEFPVVTAPGDVAPEGASVWYCPVGEASAEDESIVGLVALESVDVSLTFPSPFLGEPADTAETSLVGPGAVSVDVASVVLRGQTPGFVEFSGGPAAAAVVIVGQAGVAADGCVASAPKVWHLPGGTTRQGSSMILRLFNPFPDDAKVTITGVSEFGAVPLPEFTSLDVFARSWTNIDFNPVVPFLDDLALTVRSEGGLVIPYAVLDLGGDLAVWPGTGPATTWEFPTVGAGGLTPEIVVANPGEEEVTVVVDLYTADGPVAGPPSVTVSPGSPVRIPVDEFVSGAAAARVRADGLVAAVVEAVGVVDATDPEAEPGGEGDPAPDPVAGPFAVTTGARAPADRWLLPGIDGTLGTTATVWILNTSDADATVSMVPLGAGQVAATKVSVGAATLRSVPVRADAAGYLVESIVPVTVAVMVEGDGAVAYMAGTAVEE